MYCETVNKVNRRIRIKLLLLSITASFPTYRPKICITFYYTLHPS